MARDIQDTFVAPPCLDDIELLHEDSAILIINKPSGLLSLSGKDPRNHDSVHARLVETWPEARMVHRLDFGTSGLMIIARSKETVASLNRQFQQRLVGKVYQAVLEGMLDSESGRIDAPIARDDANFPKMQISPEGKAAQTDYRVVSQSEANNQSFVEFTPLTGRTHQLRIHSAYIGHPIIGCDIYGNQHSEAKSQRLLLHASHLQFLHPSTDEPIRFNAECSFRP